MNRDGVFDGNSGSDENDARHQLMLRMRRRAMDILSRREHSRYELGQKLTARFEESDAGLVRSTLDQLETDNLLSDQRFAESLVRMRQNRGYGPLYILSRLNQQGVSRDVVDAVLDEQDPDWLATAEMALLRKTGGDVSLDDEKQKSKLLRFLASRGFTGEQSHNALQRLRAAADERF